MFKIPSVSESLHIFGQSEKKILDKKEIQIFIWNVFKGQKGLLFEKDFEALTKNTDFILLQEAMADFKMPELWQKNHPSHHWKMAASFEYSKNNHKTGVATGSLIHSVDFHLHRATVRELFFLTPKVSLFSYYDIENSKEKLLIINTHAVNFTVNAVFRQFLSELIPSIQKHVGPLILAGDFNTWNPWRVSDLKSMLSPYELYAYEFEKDQRLLKLDHIFLRGFDVLQARIHSDVKSSDHWPLELSLRLRG